jgi:hypothetical protein
LSVSGSISTSAGEAPTWRAQLALAMKVRAEVATVSPGPRPAAVAAACNAAVPLLKATAKRASTLAASARVISSTGDFPPVARYRSLISSTSSGEVGRPPRRSSR